MMPDPIVSILVNNYNYARFLHAAIDSALTQTYPSIEVVVVDDGSTDSSREVIASYGGRIVPILKENKGQASAFNAGIAASRGDILCFLDADDVFYPGKVARVVQAFQENGADTKPIMIHHLLAAINQEGENLPGPPQGRTHASPMNLYAFAQKHRFLSYAAGPTSSISVNRPLADRLFPIPEHGVRISADDFVVYGAFLLGDVYSLAEIMGGYRLHGKNSWFQQNRAKSPEFTCALQNYLNTRLSENGLLPVISFDDSVRAWDVLIHDRRWLKLAWHMLKLCVRDHDKPTLGASYYTIRMVKKMMLQTVVKKKDAILGLFRQHPAA